MSNNSKPSNIIHQIKKNPRFQTSLLIVLAGILIVLGYYIITTYACSLDTARCVNPTEAEVFQSEASRRCLNILWLFKICF